MSKDIVKNFNSLRKYKHRLTALNVVQDNLRVKVGKYIAVEAPSVFLANDLHVRIVNAINEHKAIIEKAVEGIEQSVEKIQMDLFDRDDQTS